MPLAAARLSGERCVRSGAWREWKKLADERESFNAMMRETFGTPPAVRQLDAALISDPGFQRRYAAETGVLRGLDEPWVAVTTSFVVDGAGRIVATMRPHISGPSVAALLERYPHGLDAQTTAAIAMDVLSALSALHARGVAHRGDLVNHVIVGPDGTCVLVDEGLAPRWINESTQAAVAGDLRSFADLVARCLGSRVRSRRGRPTPPRIVRTANSSPGIGGWLPRATTNPLRPLTTRAAAFPAPGADTAAALLTELGAAAARAFEPEWDMRARERLARASQAFTEDPAPLTVPASPAPPVTVTSTPVSAFTPARTSVRAQAPPQTAPIHLTALPQNYTSNSIWPLPRSVRWAVIFAALIGVTVSFLLAAGNSNSNPVNPQTTTAPQANVIPVPPSPTYQNQSPQATPTAQISSGSASPSPSPSQSQDPNQGQSSTPTVAPSTAPPATVPQTPAGPVVNPGVIVNAGFESGDLNGWSCSSTDTITTNPVHSGSFALLGAANNSDNAQCTQSISVAPSSSYILTAWVNGSYVFIGASGTGTNDVSNWIQQTNGRYSRLSVAFTTSASTHSVTIYIHGWYAQGTYFADDLSLAP